MWGGVNNPPPYGTMFKEIGYNGYGPGSTHRISEINADPNKTYNQPLPYGSSLTSQFSSGSNPSGYVAITNTVLAQIPNPTYREAYTGGQQSLVLYFDKASTFDFSFNATTNWKNLSTLLNSDTHRWTYVGWGVSLYGFFMTVWIIRLEMQTFFITITLMEIPGCLKGLC